MSAYVITYRDEGPNRSRTAFVSVGGVTIGNVYGDYYEGLPGEGLNTSCRYQSGGMYRECYVHYLEPMRQGIAWIKRVHEGGI